MVLTQGLYTFIECTKCRDHIASSKPREDFKTEALDKGWILNKNSTLCPKCNKEKNKT